MKKKYESNINPDEFSPDSDQTFEFDNNELKEPVIEYETKKRITHLCVHSLKEIKDKLIKSEEDLAKGIYISHEDMKKRHL